MLTLDELDVIIKSCRKCRLHENRTNTVLGEGNANSRIMFVGEAPGADEDREGRPFVGKAGQLLDKAVNALDFDRNKNFYICNICKCRPENNRTPLEDEATMCIQFLRYQVAIIKPKIIVCLGATATFHPAALLRDETKKKLFWEDLKKVKVKYDDILEKHDNPNL